MSGYKGFFSYSHESDNAETGRIIALKRDIEREFKLLSGDTLEIFIDKQNLPWGIDWKNAILQSIDGCFFFIAVVTPSYLKSSMCVLEAMKFLQATNAEGGGKFFLPILYVPITQLSLSNDAAALLSHVKRTQYIDFSKIRLESEKSSEYRKCISAIAQRLVQIAASSARQCQVDGQGVDAKNLVAFEHEDRGSVPNGWLDTLVEYEARQSDLKDCLLEVEKVFAPISAGLLGLFGNSHMSPSFAELARKVNLAADLIEPHLDEVKKCAAGLEECTSATSDVVQILVQLSKHWGSGSDLEFRRIVLDASESASLAKDVFDRLESMFVHLEKSTSRAKKTHREFRGYIRTIRKSILKIESWRHLG